jgi:hypothetical protein
MALGAGITGTSITIGLSVRSTKLQK